MTTSSYRFSWSDIEKSLSTLVPAVGGNSSAARGLVTLPDGESIFVKIGTDELTKAWAKKEIAAYHFLAQQGFEYAPQLLSVNEDQTAFALETLHTSAGWDWGDAFSEARLAATLAAMDTLAALTPPLAADRAWLGVKGITPDDNGWQTLAKSTERQRYLRERLLAVDAGGVLEQLPVAVARSQEFVFQNDTLVHYDVRGDNAAWHQNTGVVKLVDWNWLSVGDRRIDLAAFLTNVHKYGLNVRDVCRERLDPEALYFMAGFWLAAASEPIWPGGPADLRGKQLQSGLVALTLAREIKG